MARKKNIYLYIFSIATLALMLLTAFWLLNKPVTHKEESLTYKEKEEITDKEYPQILEGVKARNKAEYKKALEFHFEAQELAQKSYDTIAQIIALNNIGTDLRRIGCNTKASKYYYKALQLAKHGTSDERHKSFTYNGLGNVFLSLNKNHIARQYFKKALDISTKQNNDVGRAINYANIAETFNAQLSTDSVLYYYNKSLEYNKKIKSTIGISICKKALGELSLTLGDTLKALNLTYEAFDIIKYSEDLFHKFEVQKGLCDLLLKTDRLEEAELRTKELLEIANKIGAHKNKYQTYKLIAVLKEKENKFEEAYNAKKTSSTYYDSLLIENNEINTLEFEKQQEIKRATEKVEFLTSKTDIIQKAKKKQGNIFIALSIMFLCFIALLYLRILNKKKTSRELKKINEMKSCFFGNISHELRTPLTLIKSPLEKWLSESLNPKLRTDLEIINRNSTRLLFLVDQLLNISKVDAGSFKISHKTSDLSVQLKGISQEYIHLAKEKLINYNINIEDSGLAEFDPNCIEIILMNLLSNAFKFTPIKGHINITGIKGEKHYQIAIANSDNELNEKDLGNIFDRFYTKSISYNSGTGIGLALVKELCTLHKAELKVTKKTADEIEFSVNFPILTHKHTINQKNAHTYELQYNNVNYIQNGIIPKAEENGFSEQCHESDQSKPLLLIVEDNQDMRNYIARSFESSFSIIMAKNGVEGLELARQHIPDIIISDIMMQFMDGIELCNSIKEDCHTNHIPVILLTALAEEEMILEGLANKADDYVTKPFSIKMLISKALNLIEIRKSLSEKYREEISIAPLNTLIKSGGTCFNQVLEDIFANDIVNPDFDTKQFCEKTSMSRSQLYRKLKAISGMSIAEFIRIHRLKIASELLKDNKLNVSDVCYASGFNDTSYFSKSFKDTFGVTPLEYRKTHAKEAALCSKI